MLEANYTKGIIGPGNSKRESEALVMRPGPQGPGRIRFVLCRHKVECDTTFTLYCSEGDFLILFSREQLVITVGT